MDESAILFGSQSTASRKEEKQLVRLATQHKEVSGKILPAQRAADSLSAAASLQGQLEHLDSLLQEGEAHRELQLLPMTTFRELSSGSTRWCCICAKVRSEVY